MLREAQQSTKKFMQLYKARPQFALKHLQVHALFPPPCHILGLSGSSTAPHKVGFNWAHFADRKAEAHRVKQHTHTPGIPTHVL